MRGGHGPSGQGSIASRVGAQQPAEPPSPAPHCFVDGEPGLLVQWRQGSGGWEGRVISMTWVDAVGWASLERWLAAQSISGLAALSWPGHGGGPRRC
jgi:hypothetical protein